MSYLVHGVSVAVAGSWGELEAAIDGRLRPFLAPAGASPDLRMDYVAVPDARSHVVPPPPATARPVYTGPAGEVRYSDGDDSLWLSVGDRVRARVDLGGGTLLASVENPGPAEVWLLSHPLLTVPLLEVLKRRSRFGLHAAGASRDGLAVLLPGGSGAGKSTLALALLHAGFPLLSDDTVYLEATPSGDVAVLAFPDEIDLSDETIALFPELVHLLDTPRPAGWPKRPYRPGSAWFDASLPAMRPAALVFPRVARCSTSRIEPMAEHEALLELVPNILLTDPGSAEAHLDALGALCRQCPSFRLHTGTDLERLPERLFQLIDTAG